MNKIKTTGFWISLGGAVVLVLQTIGELFGFSINSQVVNTLISSVCGVLVVVGILIPTKTDSLKLNLPGINFNENSEQLEQSEQLQSVEQTTNEQQSTNALELKNVEQQKNNKQVEQSKVE